MDPAGLVTLYLRRDATQPGFWRVLAEGGLTVGVIQNANPIFPRRWQWSITALPRRRDIATSGSAASREEAMAAFHAAWDLAEVDLAEWRRHMADVKRAATAWEPSRRGR